jgi:cysteine/O-acetylserine efflux protein
LLRGASFLATTTEHLFVQTVFVFLFALSAFGSTSTWALCGAAIRKHLHQPRVRVLVNAVLVLLLVYTAVDLSGIASLAG